MPMPGYVFRDVSDRDDLICPSRYVPTISTKACVVALPLSAREIDPRLINIQGGPIPDSELDEQQRAHNAPGDTTRADAVQPSTSSSSTFNTPTSSAASDNHPSDSHALANADHDEKGTAQLAHHGGEVRDLGWNEHLAEVAEPLVGGLSNEELWTLVRRFNKQIYHVRATNATPPGGLDLNIVEDEEFSPDKLRSNLERLYMTVIIGLMGFGKHIARIRSWREPRRTSAFAVVRLAKGQWKAEQLIYFRLMPSRGPSTS